MEDGMTQGRDGEQEETGVENGKKDAGSIITHLLSNFMPEKKPKGTQDGEEHIGSREHVENPTEEDGRIDGDGDEEKGSGDEGLIGHLISNLVSSTATSPEASAQSAGKRKAQVLDAENGGDGQGGGASTKAKSNVDRSAGWGAGGGGGVIDTLLSSFLHTSEGGGESAENDEGEKIIRAAGRREAPVEEKERGGGRSGGIIDSIVSHLPPDLPDDAAPTTDEAFILIHSMVRD